MSELKRCPFCGGEAATIESYNYKAGEFLPAVMCLGCKSRTITFLNAEDAIKAWNTRKPVEETLERLGKLRKYEENNDCPKDCMCDGGHCDTCYTDTAIQIIKEEFNIDELQNSSETRHSETKCCNMEHIQQRFERVM